MNRTRRSDWLRAHHARPNRRLTLVCFPHAGGTANYYRSWAAAISGEIELLVVQYPGREDRSAEPLIDNLRELADGAADDILTGVSGPLALFGHSMGSLVAFEVAARLSAQGVRPTHLVASGQPGPGRRKPTSLRLATDDELVADITSLGGTDDALRDHPELLALVLPIVRNDYHAVETYQPTSTTLTCPITACYGAADTHVTEVGVDHWRERTADGFEWREFPGHHFYVQEQRDDLLRFTAERVLS